MSISAWASFSVIRDPAISQEVWRLKRELNNHPDVHLELRFDEHLAHLVYAGADMVVMPGNMEPCGLVQMIALKHGTVPIVRAVGGLARARWARRCSTEISPTGRLMLNGMRADYSWNHPGQDYLNIYDYIRHK